MGFEQHSDLFIEESLDILASIETPLMELEESPDRSDLVDEIFRALHTIKGSAGMFGFDEISRFTHNLETTFDAIRKGELAATPEIIDLTLKAKDSIRELILNRDNKSESEIRENILSRLLELTGRQHQPDKQADEAVCEEPPVETTELKHYRIRFTPDKEIILRGVLPAPLFRELEQYGTMSIQASVDAVPYIDKINPEHSYLSWTIDIETGRTEKELRTVFMFVEDFSNIEFEELPFTGAEVNMENSSVLESNRISPDMKNTQKGGAHLERRKVDTTSIRVKNEKLDMLVNMVGELVTLHSNLAQESNDSRIPEFMAISEGLGRLTADLRDITMSIRMVPLEETFLSYNRLIHDLSKNLGKKIRLESQGGETELDKNVIEELRDPLMHLIRNAADHGIEIPGGRRAAGKDETGVIKLEAEHSGASVVIRVSDDGAGLNRDKILSRAIERGIAIPAEADDRTILSLIFEPGFSTAEITTDISGRGVGMDVVKRNMEKLRGAVDISSEPGKGTRISLTIPLTLAIIDGFMVEVCGHFYIFNLAIVRECVAYNQKTSGSDEQGLMRLRGEMIPFIDIRTMFNLGGMASAFPQVVVTEVDGMVLGFLVDRVIGHCQTVIKPLGRGIQNADMFSGASILGSGSIALILDANRIISRVVRSMEEQHAVPSSAEQMQTKE